MEISYSNSKAVKITADMRDNLNDYNQRKNQINNYSVQIDSNQLLIDEKSAEIKKLEALVNSEDKREAKDANRRIRNLQKEIDRLMVLNSTTKEKMDELLRKQNSADISGVKLKTFPEYQIEEVQETIEDNAPIEEEVLLNDEINGEYNEEESYIPEHKKTGKSVTEDFTPTKEDIEAIWDSLHKYDEPSVDEEIKTDDVIKPVNEEDLVETSIEDEIKTDIKPEVTEEVTPKEEIERAEEPMIIEPKGEMVPETDAKEEISSIIEPTVIAEETETEENVKTKIENDIHDQVSNEFPEIDIPLPMDSEKRLNEIYRELDIEPEMPEETEIRDLKDLTLFVDYNDYTFAFAQQHYDKEALKPEEIAALGSIKSYLTEKEFETKRTSQYRKITNENKRLNKKIVSLSKEFTRTTEKLSKDYIKTTDDLTLQINRAKEQIEVDRVEKVQTQKLNDSLTDNIKEQAAHIEELLTENNSLKETIEKRDRTIKELENVVSDQKDRIKVFDEKLSTVLGIVKEVKGDKRNVNKE